jgi:hypothetical protein
MPVRFSKSVHRMAKENEMNSWERYIARSFELRLERDTELKNIQMCWVWYWKQTLLLESLENTNAPKGLT